MPKPADLLLCAECEEVYSRDLKACPSCTGTSALPLSRLTGEAKGEELISGRRKPRLVRKTA